MLRLTHTQTASGPLLINDIDDGLPNKTARRGVAPPYSYERDGYANASKQPCYIPRVDPNIPTIAGHIDLTETDRVLLSQAKGVIAGFIKAGLLTAVSFVAGDVVAPVLTLAKKDTTVVGDLTLTGTGFTSLAPYLTSVVITGTGAVTLTAAAITAAGGTVGATSIAIPASLVPGIVETATSVKVISDNLSSAVVAVTLPVGVATPVLTSATLGSPGAGDLTIAGTDLDSLAPYVTSVVLTGTGAVTLTRAAIVAGGGSANGTAIVIPAALVPGIAATSTSAKVLADGKSSAVVAVAL